MGLTEWQKDLLHDLSYTRAEFEADLDNARAHNPDFRLFATSEPKIGATLTLKRPARYLEQVSHPRT